MEAVKDNWQINPLLRDYKNALGMKDANPQHWMWSTLASSYGIQLQPKEHKIFLSGPMTGYVLHNYPMFEQVEECLVMAGYKVVNPAKIGLKFDPNKVDGDKKLYRAMTKEIQEAEKTCTVILLLPGWEDSVGVRLELKTALKLNMKIIQWRN